SAPAVFPTLVVSLVQASPAASSCQAPDLALPGSAACGGTLPRGNHLTCRLFRRDPGHPCHTTVHPPFPNPAGVIAAAPLPDNLAAASFSNPVRIRGHLR